jgi:carboxymethylenebutenolidase
MGETIRIEARDGSGSFAAYLADAPGAKAGIVVVQEIFGVNPGIQAIADNWAAQGFAAVAPDLFWRIEPDVQIDADAPGGFDRAIGLMKKFSLDTGVADIEAAIKTLRARGCTKVGVVGYCLGGLLSYLSAARTDSDATVAYYGGGIDKYLGEQHAIGKPLMLHNATHDHFASDEAKAAIKAGLSDNRHVTLHYYDADHAFARHQGSTRVPECAELADARTLEFFRQHLA